MERLINGKELLNFPTETAFGAMSYYITHASKTKFQPMNINFGIMKDLGYKVKKKDRKAEYAKVAVEKFDSFIKEELGK